MSRLRLALFDVDGTLVDSQAHIKMSMIAAFSSEGLEPPADEATLGIVGLSLAVAVSRLAPDLDSDQVDRIVAAYKDAYAGLRGADAAASSPLYPGALECLDRLAEDDHVLIGVATGKSRRGLDHLMALHGLEGRFVTIQVSDNHPSKPHPSMVLAAMAETGVAPSDTVMIGDTSFDMEMGRAAGARRLGVAWGYHPASSLSVAGAERLAEAYEDVPAHLTALWGE